MKITRIQIRKINISRVWTPVICRIFTDEGIYGDGEAGMAYGMGATGAMGMLVDYANQIIGMDALAHEIVWDKLFRATFWGKAAGSPGYSAISAIDMALWDIKAKHYGVPVYELLGGKRRNTLRCYASQLQYGWGEQPECLGPTAEYADAARKAVAEGYTGVKIDFFTFDKDRRPFEKQELLGLMSCYYTSLFEERLSAVRSAVGDTVDIIVENHANTDVGTAIQLGHIAERYHVSFMEEPCLPNVKLTKQIAQSISLPVAHGERLFTRWEYLPFFEEGAVRIIQPDIGNCGGMTEAKKICDIALAYDVGVQAHLCASPLSTAAAMHLECTLPNFIIHEHHRNSLYPHNKCLCTLDPQPVNGSLTVPEGPGWGCEFTAQTMSRADADEVMVQ